MLTPGVKGLLIANGVIFLFQGLLGWRTVHMLGLTPAIFWSKGALWQPVTYLFMHGGFTHLLFNMLALWIFGGALESLWGTRQFLRYYFLTGVGAGLSNCILTPGMPSVIIGASGAIYGLLAAYGLLFPNSMIYIYLLFPIRAKYLVLIFAVLAFMGSLRPGTSAVAHLVHLGGMVIGVVYLRRDTMLRWGARKLRSLQREREQQQQRRRTESEEQLRREVDDLLDKINEVGIENLTPWERRRLREASEMLRQMEERER